MIALRYVLQWETEPRTGMNQKRLNPAVVAEFGASENTSCPTESKQ